MRMVRIYRLCGLNCRSALSAKSVSRWIFTPAYGTDGIRFLHRSRSHELFLRSARFERLSRRGRRGVFFGRLELASSLFGDENLRSFVLDFLQQLADCLLAFSRRIVEVRFSPAAQVSLERRI